MRAIGRTRPAVGLGGLTVLVVVVALLGGGCEIATEPVATARPSDSGPTPSPDANQAFLNGAIGTWRHAPLFVSEENGAPFVEICRSNLPPEIAAVETMPVVVIDVRGLRLGTVVFADDTQAFECQVTLEPDGIRPDTAVIRELPMTAPPPASDGIDILRIAIDESNPQAIRSFVIGRVGDEARSVAAAFADDTEVDAAMSNGWYAAWWPGAVQPTTVVAADGRSIVISGLPAPSPETNL